MHLKLEFAKDFFGLAYANFFAMHGLFLFLVYPCFQKITVGKDLFVHKAINTNTNDLSNKSMDNRISVLEYGAFCGVVSAFIIGRLLKISLALLTQCPVFFTNFFVRQGLFLFLVYQCI